MFDSSSIRTLTLTMDAADWADTSDDPWAENWHTATFEWEGEEVAEVGVRAFGYSSHVAGKPPLKIDFDHLVEGQEWRGLEQVKLRNGYGDASFLHDTLATWLLRRAGVPASRTGWVRLVVNGATIGLYTLMEPIDDRFLARTYGDDDGPLYSIDGIRGHGLMPLEDPLAYFQYNTSVTGDGSDLVDLTRIVTDGTDEELAAVVDLDDFWVESIARTLMGSQDSFSADGNNFYLYNDPAQDADPTDLHGTWHVIPWDYNFDFTTFGLLPALRVEPSRPWATSDYAFDPYTNVPYVDVLMERQVAARDVDAEVRTLAETAFAWEEVRSQVLAWEALIAADVAEDPIGNTAAFEQAVANDLLYLHMRLTSELGEEVATCATFEEGAIAAGELSPTGTVGWSELTVDGWRWATDGSVCAGSDAPCVGFDVATTHYCTGLYTHAPSDVTITVPDAGELVGAVGLQLFAEDCSGGASFRVEQDGVTLWESGVLGSYSEAEPLAVSVAAGTVRLVTDPLDEYACDTTSWLDLRWVPG